MVEVTTASSLMNKQAIISKKNKIDKKENDRKAILSGKAILIFFNLIIILFSAYQVLGKAKYHADWYIWVSAILSVWIVIYLSSSYLIFRSFYLFATAYILSLSIFHLGHVVPHTFGIFNASFLVSGDMARWYERAGWYTILSLGALGFGLGLAISTSRAATGNDNSFFSADEKRFFKVFWTGIGLLLASLAAIALAIYSVGNILLYSRSEIFGGIGDTRGIGLFLVVCPSSAVLLIIGAQTLKQKLFALFITAFIFLILMLSGYRSAVFFPALIGAVLWVKVGRKIPLIVAVCAILFVLLAIPAIRVIRDVGAYTKINRDVVQKSFEDSEIGDVFKELGATGGLLAHVIKLVPQKTSYRNGATYLNAFKNVIPNIGARNRTSGRSEFQNKINLNKDAEKRMSPADWFIYHANRWKFHSGAGSGFSTIAEAYLNFGTIGVITFFLIIGYLLGWLDRANLSCNPKLIIFSVIILWPLMKTVRNDFGSFVKPVSLTLSVMFIWYIGTNWLFRIKGSK